MDSSLGDGDSPLFHNLMYRCAIKITHLKEKKNNYSEIKSSDFVNHLHDYRPNWTPLSLIIIININISVECHDEQCNLGSSNS